MLTIVPNIPRCKILGEIPQEAERALKSQMKYWDESWGGEVKLYDAKAQTFPRGCLARVDYILQYLGIPCVVLHSLPPKTETPDFSYLPELRPYQQQLVDKMSDQPWCILKAPPRSGKTVMVTHDWIARGFPQSVYLVDSIVLAEQVQRTIAGYTPRPVGMIGDGRHSIGDLTVVTSQSAFSALYRTGIVKSVAKREKWMGDAEADVELPEATRDLLLSATYLIRDEAHHATCSMDRAILRSMKSTYWRRFLSATPWDEKTSGYKLEEVGGPLAAEISYGELFDLGYLVRPTIFFVKLPRKKYKGGTVWASIYPDYIVQNQQRNQIIADFVRQLRDVGKSVCILVERTTHGDELLTYLPEAERMYGGAKTGGRSHREFILEGIEANEFPVISTVMGEGVDVPSLDAVVVAGGGKASIGVFQRQRAMTAFPGKTACYVLDFWDHAKYLFSHSKRRCELYEMEGFTVVESSPHQISQHLDSALRSEDVETAPSEEEPLAFL